jgi:predicted acetyltransferase
MVAMDRDTALRLEVLARRRSFLLRQQAERGANVSVHVAREIDALTFAITALKRADDLGLLGRLEASEAA